jgi:hypothetical protein
MADKNEVSAGEYAVPADEVVDLDPKQANLSGGCVRSATRFSGARVAAGGVVAL